MQLAQECLKDPPEASEEPPAQLEGLEMFAQTIETGELKLCVTASMYGQQNFHCIHRKVVVGIFPRMGNMANKTFGKMSANEPLCLIFVCSPSSH